MKDGCVDPAEPAASRREGALCWVWKESRSFEGWRGRESWKSLHVALQCRAINLAGSLQGFYGCGRQGQWYGPLDVEGVGDSELPSAGWTGKS